MLKRLFPSLELEQHPVVLGEEFTWNQTLVHYSHHFRRRDLKERWVLPEVAVFSRTDKYTDTGSS